MLTVESNYKSIFDNVTEPLKDEWWDKILVVGAYTDDEITVSIMAWLDGIMHAYETARVDAEILNDKTNKVIETLENDHKLKGWNCISLAMNKDREIEVSYDLE